MKDRVLFLVLVFIFVLVVFTYARYNSIQEGVLKSEIQGLYDWNNQVLGLMQHYDRVHTSYSSRLDHMEQSLIRMDMEKQQLQQKVEAVNSDVSKMRQAPVKAEQQVELGAIPVKKGGKK